MEDKIVINVYENQSKNLLRGWTSDTSRPWTLYTFEICNPLDQFILPARENWIWASNWQLLSHDEGWEYASRHSRFKKKDRPVKTNGRHFDNARRRRWCRILQKDEVRVRLELSKLLIPKIQSVLSFIQETRFLLDELLTDTSQDHNNENILALVDTVQRHVKIVSVALNDIHPTKKDYSYFHLPPYAAIIKKLKNDVSREEVYFICQSHIS